MWRMCSLSAPPRMPIVWCGSPVAAMLLWWERASWVSSLKGCVWCLATMASPQDVLALGVRVPALPPLLITQGWRWLPI